MRPLTPAQKRVLVLIARGLTAPEIAVQLSNSSHTIIRHRREILRRLDAHTAPQAITNAFCAGLLTPDDFT